MGKQISLLDGRRQKLYYKGAGKLDRMSLCLSTGGKKAIYMIRTIKILSSARISFFLYSVPTAPQAAILLWPQGLGPDVKGLILPLLSPKT